MFELIPVGQMTVLGGSLSVERGSLPPVLVWLLTHRSVGMAAIVPGRARHGSPTSGGGPETLGRAKPKVAASWQPGAAAAPQLGLAVSGRGACARGSADIVGLTSLAAKPARGIVSDLGL